MTDKIGGMKETGWKSVVARTLGYPNCNPSIKWQDIEDIASIAMMTFVSRTTQDNTPRVHWCVVDAIRKHLGTVGSKRFTAVNFSDLPGDEDSDYESLLPVYDGDDFDRVEVEELIHHLNNRFGDPITGQVVRDIVLNNSTIAGAWERAGESSYANALRKLKKFKARVQEHMSIDKQIKDESDDENTKREEVRHGRDCSPVSSRDSS